MVCFTIGTLGFGSQYKVLNYYMSHKDMNIFQGSAGEPAEEPGGYCTAPRSGVQPGGCEFSTVQHIQDTTIRLWTG